MVNSSQQILKLSTQQARKTILYSKIYKTLEWSLVNQFLLTDSGFDWIRYHAIYYRCWRKITNLSLRCLATIMNEVSVLQNFDRVVLFLFEGLSWGRGWIRIHNTGFGLIFFSKKILRTRFSENVWKAIIYILI